MVAFMSKQLGLGYLVLLFYSLLEFTSFTAHSNHNAANEMGGYGRASAGAVASSCSGRPLTSVGKFDRL